MSKLGFDTLIKGVLPPTLDKSWIVGECPKVDTFGQLSINFEELHSKFFELLPPKLRHPLFSKFERVHGANYPIWKKFQINRFAIYLLRKSLRDLFPSEMTSSSGVNFKEVEKQILAVMNVDQTYNRGDELPMSYLCPASDGKVTWTCDLDQDRKITSVFSCSEDKDNNQIAHLENMEAACKIRDELVVAGWISNRPPKMTFSFPEGERALTSKEKKKLAKRLAKKGVPGKR